MTQQRHDGDGGGQDIPPMFTTVRTGAVSIALVVEDLSPTGLGYLLSVINETAARVGRIKLVATRTLTAEPEQVRQVRQVRRSKRSPRS